METTLDRIEAELAELDAIDARVTARRLVLIAQADRMQAAHMDGARTMTEWVARHGDMTHGRAKRLVRTAKAVPPAVFERLVAGSISVDRAHAYTEAALRNLDLGSLEGLEIAGVRHLLRRHRPSPRPVDSYVALQPSLDEGHYSLHGRLNPTQGAAITQALAREIDDLLAGIPACERPPHNEAAADALESLCTRGGKEVVVSVHRTEQGGVEIDGVRASDAEGDLADCLGTEEVVTATATSRSRKNVSPKQRRRILYRDHHRCSIDGCDSRSRLEVHHLIPRSRGGPNEDGLQASLEFPAETPTYERSE